LDNKIEVRFIIPCSKINPIRFILQIIYEINYRLDFFFRENRTVQTIFCLSKTIGRYGLVGAKTFELKKLTKKRLLKKNNFEQSFFI